MKKKFALLSFLLLAFITLAPPLDTKAVGEGVLNGTLKYTGKNADLFMPVLDSLLCDNVTGCFILQLPTKFNR